MPSYQRKNDILPEQFLYIILRKPVQSGFFKGLGLWGGENNLIA